MVKSASPSSASASCCALSASASASSDYGPERVQVTLHEFAVAVLARPVCPPDRAHGVALVGTRQLAAIGSSDARQRDRHVVAQREVGLPGRLVLAAAQDLEDQLVALLAVLAQQHVEPLEGRRLQRLEAVAREDRPDDGERMLPLLDVGGEEITRP